MHSLEAALKAQAGLNLNKENVMPGPSNVQNINLTRMIDTKFKRGSDAYHAAERLAAGETLNQNNPTDHRQLSALRAADPNGFFGPALRQLGLR